MLGIGAQRLGGVRTDGIVHVVATDGEYVACAHAGSARETRLTVARLSDLSAPPLGAWAPPAIFPGRLAGWRPASDHPRGPSATLPRRRTSEDEPQITHFPKK